MEVLKNGIYTAINSTIFYEKHGGVDIRRESYAHLFIKDKEVGLYFSGKNWYKPFVNSKTIDLKGEVLYWKKNSFELNIINPYSDENIIATGKILKGGDLLYLKAWNAKTPTKIWLENDFEWVDIDYNNLAAIID